MTEYFNDIGNISLPIQEEEIELAKKIEKGGIQGKLAFDKLVSANLRLVVSIAKDIVLGQLKRMHKTFLPFH